MQELPAHESTIRLSIFLAVLTLMAIWELAAPRRRVDIPRLLRWSNNLALVAVDTAIVRLVFPVLAVGLATIAAERGWGVLNLVELPSAIAFVLSMLVFDLAIYAQHVAFHHIPVLWRIHRMHHSDLEFDVTTGVRFHPLEIVLSMAIKLGLVLIIGPPALAVLVFEIVLNATSLFNHSNIKLPRPVDRLLRLVVVTPDMHRVHHSVIRKETDSNFGFNVPWWDRMFGTYRAQPAAGHKSMTIGIELFRSTREIWMDKLLSQPFRNTGHGPKSDRE